MASKEFSRAFENPVIIETGEPSNESPEIRSHAGFQLILLKDRSHHLFRVSLLIRVLWSNASTIEWQSAAIIEIPYTGAKPAIVYLTHIAKETMIELNARFENSPEFEKTELLKTDIIFTDGNLETIEQMWRELPE